MAKSFSCVHFVREVRAEQGGVVQAVVDLCQAIAARGHQTTLVTCDAKDVPAVWNKGEGSWPQVIELAPSRLSNLLLSRSGLKRFHEIIKHVDLVHLHTPWELCNFQLMRLLRREKIPYLVTIHGMLDDWSMQQKTLKKRTFLTLGGRRLFRFATAIHFTAEGEQDQASQWLPIGDRAVVQCYALDLSSYDPLPGPEPALKAYPFIRPEKKKVLFLSRLHPKKGIELLLQAGAILRDRQLPIQLLIAGPSSDEYLNQLKNTTRQLGLVDHTHFLGMVRGVEKRSLYQLSDVFVLPTHQENFGLVIAEAMACGTPVVTTRGTDIWKELQQGGVQIVDWTPEAIAAAITEATSDSQVRERIGQQGQEFVNRWLDRDRVLDGYEQIYRDTIAKGPRE